MAAGDLLRYGELGSCYRYLKLITNTVHVSKYRGQKVAVDAYYRLYKAAYGCAEGICWGRSTWGALADVFGAAVSMLPSFS